MEHLYKHFHVGFYASSYHAHKYNAEDHSQCSHCKCLKLVLVGSHDIKSMIKMF